MRPCHCPNCRTPYWRQRKQLGHTEHCGVCLGYVVLEEGHHKLGPKKPYGHRPKNQS